MPKPSIHLIFVFCLLPGLCLANSQIYALIQRNNADVQSAYSDFLKKTAALESALLAGSPHIDLKGETEFIGNYNSKISNETSVLLEITIPIYDGGQRNARIQQRIEEKLEARFAYFDAINRARAAAISACADYESQTKSLDLIDQAVATMAFLQHAIDLQSEKGATTLFEVQNAILLLEKAKSMALRLKGQRAQTQAQFEYLTGGELSACSSVGVNFKPVKNASTIVNSNIKVRAQSAQVAAREHAVDFAKRKSALRIEGKLSAGLVSNSLSLADAKGRLSAEIIAELELNGQNLSSEVRQAQHLLNQEKYRLRSFTLEVASELQQVIALNRSLESQYSQSSIEIDRLRSAIAGIVEQTSLGSSTVVEELNLNSDLLTALISQAEVDRDRKLTVIEIDRIAGRFIGLK